MPTACSRCGSPATANLPPPRCTACFHIYLHRTFKTALGKAGAGGQPHKVAVGLSGGACSTSLALLLKAYASSLLRKPNSATARPLLVHVAVDKASDSVEKVAQVYEEAELKVVHVEEKVVAQLRAVKDATDRAVLARMAVEDVLVKTAKQNGCEVVLLGTSATRAASDILLSMVVGRGGRTDGMGKAVEVRDGVRVVKALLGIESRLLVKFAREFVGGFEVRNVGSVVGYREGLVDVVERFVGGVENGNRASVFNVVKTAARLGEVDGEGEEVFWNGVGERGGQNVLELERRFLE